MIYSAHRGNERKLGEGAFFYHSVSDGVMEADLYDLEPRDGTRKRPRTIMTLRPEESMWVMLPNEHHKSVGPNT